MGKEQQNKAIVGRWFTEFWGKNVNLAVIDEIAWQVRSRRGRCSRRSGQRCQRP